MHYFFGGSFVLLFIAFLLFIPERGHVGDLGFWERWTVFMKTEGLPYAYHYGTVYSTIYPCNYPPIILYLFYLFGCLIPDVEWLATHSNYFKIIPLVFDFISAGAIFLLVKWTVKNSFLPLLLLLSPAVMYNSYLWGQMDSIVTAFVMLAILFALRSNWKLSIIFFIIALNTKLQAVVFFPVVILALIPLINSWKKLGVSIVLSILTQFIILLPFIIYGTLDSWYQVMTSLVDQYTDVSLNAFNLWHLLLEGETPLVTKDYELFWFGISYKSWGLLLFFIFSFFVLVPLLLKSTALRFKKSAIDNNFKKLVFLCAFLCILSFFFFNTQMHERYSHPALIMALCFGILSKNYWLYGITSIAYFLNMERTLRFFEISYGTFIFQKSFIAALFLLALILGLIYLYKNYSSSNDWLYIRHQMKK